MGPDKLEVNYEIDGTLHLSREPLVNELFVYRNERFLVVGTYRGTMSVLTLDVRHTFLGFRYSLKGRTYRFPDVSNF